MTFGKTQQFKPIIDIHSHILPGIDDGSKDFETSIEMARTAYENGVRGIIVTPHKKEYVESADPETIERLIKELDIKLTIYELPIKLYPGNEIMRSSNFEFNDNNFCFLNNSNYLLVEFDPNDPFNKIYDYLNNLKRSGLEVVLAHVERYYCLLEKYQRVEDIIDLDILMQINYHTVINKENKETFKFVHKLLKDKYVSFVASDAHDLDKRSYDIGEALAYLYGHYDSSYVEEITHDNAIKYLGASDGTE